MIMKIVNWISTEIIRLPMVLFDRDGIRLNRSTAVENIAFFFYFFFFFFFFLGSGDLSFIHFPH